MPDVRHCSVDRNLIADVSAEPVIDVGRRRLHFLLRRQLDRRPVLSGALTTQIRADGLPVVPVDLCAQAALLVNHRLKYEDKK